MPLLEVDRISEWLEGRLGTPDFAVEGLSITLLVPESWPVQRGLDDVLRFEAVGSWQAAADAFDPEVGHAIGDRSDTAMCGGLTAASMPETLVDVTCPDCLLRVIATEVAFPPGPTGSRRRVLAKDRPTLHVEIARILEEHGGWMTTAELAAAVNAAGRYRKRDGSPVVALQIHGRTRNYSKLFERKGSRVYLRLEGDAE
jgi:hypothetical protein